MDYVSLVLVFCVGTLLGKYLPSYLSKKGENLATKEDIAEITREVERVKSEYTERLEGIAEHLRYRNQLRLAALDRRLQAHQEAYALLGKLRSAAHATEPISDVFEECNAWWNNNCLYLEADAREKFLGAYYAAQNHPELKRRAAECGSPENMADLDKNWKKINDAPEAIVKAVELPSLGEQEHGLGNSSEDEDGS